MPPFYPEPTQEEREASDKRRADLAASGWKPTSYPPPPARPKPISGRDQARLMPLTFETGKTIEELLKEEQDNGNQ
jgi:hypothetical protein